MVEVLVEPWREPILRQALIELLLAAVACSALGVWVVLFGISYGAESLAHAMFPGLALAAVIGAPLVLGGAAGLAVAGVAIALAARVRSLGADNAVAVVVTSLFGLGTLLALAPDSPPGLKELLFGDVLASSRGDLLLAAALAAVVLAGVWLGHWRLLAAGFDPSAPHGLGVDVALFGLLAVAVLVGVQSLGNLLVVAAVIAPAAAARRLTRRVAPMVVVACAIGVAAAVAGMYLSYYAQVAAGASIALVLVATVVVMRLIPVIVRPG